MRPIMDIHAHSYYSLCGRDKMEDIVKAAVAGGVEVFGISDHNYGIADRIEAYRQEIDVLRQRYAGQLRLLTGFEIATAWPDKFFDTPEKLNGFDYCLLEHIDMPESAVGMGVFDYRKRFHCAFGIAHTDLFAMAEAGGLDPETFLRRFAENDIFWEMNVSYDSIHNYREHPYVLRFLQDERQQEIARRSGIRFSVGFDGHRVEDYRPDRVRQMNAFLEEKDLPVVEL